MIFLQYKTKDYYIAKVYKHDVSLLTKKNL